MGTIKRMSDEEENALNNALNEFLLSSLEDPSNKSAQYIHLLDQRKYDEMMSSIEEIKKVFSASNIGGSIKFDLIEPTVYRNAYNFIINFDVGRNGGFKINCVKETFHSVNLPEGTNIQIHSSKNGILICFIFYNIFYEIA